ncbi:MAG: C25 family cysteine peptidase, partial [Thermoplasmatota archaeon]
MKKSFVAGFVCILLLVGMFPLAGTIVDVEQNNNARGKTNTTPTATFEDSILCSAPLLSANGAYCSLLVEEATTYTNNPGEPVLPVVTKTYVFPMGTIISDVSCTPVEIYEMSIEKEIGYALHPVPCGSIDTSILTEKDASIYEGSDFYPTSYYDVHIGVGLDGGKRVTYVTVQFYPVRYSPQQNLIQYAEHADIQIRQQPPEHAVALTDAYDLLIIAPQAFESDLQPLVDHKEAMGVSTNMVVTEDIYGNFEGRDEAEQIKYYIKYAIEEWNITYVLLFGGMQGQRFWSWHIPVRYAHVQPNLGGELGLRKPYVSDLYYADIYQYDEETGFSFDDWDADGDGVFSEWIGWSDKDVVDLYPDVYIGRLPCRYKKDVSSIVDRIITYETTTYGEEWFHRMAVAGGDTYIDSRYGYTTDFDEGKEMTAYALNFMPDFEPTRIWTDGDGDIEYTSENIMDVLNQGHGFYLYSGHGNPTSFATHPHGDDSIWIGINNSDIKNLNNGDKLPIYVLSNCDNCQFNVSLLKFLKIITHGFDQFLIMEIAPYCLGWLSSYLETGGAIAALGVTTIGLNAIGDDDDNGICDISEYFDGWIHAHYFSVYNQSIDILGQIFGQTISDYLNQFPINWNAMANTESHHTVPVVQYNALIG